VKNIIKKYYFGIIAILTYFLLRCYSPKILPDILNLSSINPASFFELLITSTTSIFGILIAVVLLTFEFVKHTAFRRKEENILTKSVVTNLVSVAISVIVLSLISYSSIQDFNESNNLTIAYFLGLLFVGFITSIFPATKGILDTANTLKNTKKEIQNLTITQFKEILSLQDTKFISKDSSLVLVRIRLELLNSVRECDFESYTAILEELNNKAIELIGNGDNRITTEIVFRGTSFIWNAGNFEALRVGNHQFFETIWECIEELYEYAAKEKILLLNFEFLDYFTRDFIKFLSRNKLGNSLSSGAKVLSNIFKQNLKFNCPPQEEINDLYYMFEDGNKMPHIVDSSLQWLKLNEFVSLITNIQTSAIENIDKELYDTCRFELEYIIREIGYNSFPNLKIYQEAYIVIRIISHQTYNGYNANESNLFKESMWTFHIDTSYISEIIRNEKFYVGRILEDISDFLIKSQRKERLDTTFSLNYWGALGRIISKDYIANKTVQEAMEYILDTLDALKQEIELNQLPNQAKNYNEIKKQFESIKTWLLRDNEEKEISVIIRINESLNKFIEVSGKTDFRIVKWNGDIKKDETENKQAN